MMRYRLRTLLIVLAVGPPVLAPAIYGVVWVIAAISYVNDPSPHKDWPTIPKTAATGIRGPHVVPAERPR